MTRIVGVLQGPSGPLNGRLYVKPSAAFIGAPADGTSFKIENGSLDIELPANVGGTVWLVDWKDQFDWSPVTYIEQWRVPFGDTVALEEVRGYGVGLKRRDGAAKADALDLVMWKQQAQEAEGKLAALEHERARLLLKVSSAEGKAAAAAGKTASLNAQIGRLQQELVKRQTPTVRNVETVIEKQVMPEEARQALALEKQKSVLLEQQVDALQEELNERLSLVTHFSSLHGEIDRLKAENQELRLRIEELRQPARNTTALRREAIENLNRLIEG